MFCVKWMGTGNRDTAAGNDFLHAMVGWPRAGDFFYVNPRLTMKRKVKYHTKENDHTIVKIFSFCEKMAKITRNGLSACVIMNFWKLIMA